jgi:hypothetical protein
MSQANPKYSEFEIAPKRDRQSPETNTNLPVYELTDEVDPTQEIRTLINELHTVARDARLQLMGVEHQRDDAVRQLNEALWRQEESDRRAQESAAKLADIQKQVLSIRQARDAAQAQNLAVTNRLLRAEDEIAELQYAREDALKAADARAEKTTAFCEQLDAVSRERDAAIKEVGDLRSELEEQRRKALELAEQESAMAQADSEQATALAQARAEVLALTQKHDVERNRAQEQAREAEEARQQIVELRTRVAENTHIASELEEIRGQLAAVTADRDLQFQRGEGLLLKSVSQEEQLAAVTEELVAALRKRQEALENAARDEVRRLQPFDLASELESTWREVLKTCASLQLKLAQTSRPL